LEIVIILIIFRITHGFQAVLIGQLRQEEVIYCLQRFQNLLVHKLIHGMRNTQEIFWPIDAQRILKIPLARGMMDDFVSWHYSKTGIFFGKIMLSS
jgi:hypothetical protein